jgi:hypothetical protein
VGSDRPTHWGMVAAAAAIVACCALLPTIGLGAGLASAAAGAAMRYWPLILAGTALAVWGSVALVRSRRGQGRQKAGPVVSTYVEGEDADATSDRHR